jgi:hypothetical protein
MIRENFEYVSEHHWNMAPRSKSLRQRRCGVIGLILLAATLLALFASCASSPEVW